MKKSQIYCIWVYFCIMINKALYLTMALKGLINSISYIIILPRPFQTNRCHLVIFALSDSPSAYTYCIPLYGYIIKRKKKKKWVIYQSKCAHVAPNVLFQIKWMIDTGAKKMLNLSHILLVLHMSKRLVNDPCTLTWSNIFPTVAPLKWRHHQFWEVW